MQASIAAAVLACVAGMSGAEAQVTQGAMTYISLDVNGESAGAYKGVAGPASLSAGTTYGFTLGAPDPTAVAATSISNVASNSSATVSLTYYFEVVGPGSKVPIDISGVTVMTGALGSARGLWGGMTQGVLFGTNGDVPFGYSSVSVCGADLNECGGAQPPSPGAYTTGAQSVTLGEIYGISIEAEAAAFFDASAYVSIDPTITIDGSVSNPGAYQIALSDGIGNPAAPTSVPEPAAWTLLLLGFGGLGAVLRRARQSGLSTVAVMAFR